jgi:hypothetical protein
VRARTRVDMELDRDEGRARIFHLFNANWCRRCAIRHRFGMLCNCLPEFRALVGTINPRHVYLTEGRTAVPYASLAR